MREFEYKDIEYMNVGLPEDILKKKWFGDFNGALKLIDLYLIKDISDALRKKLELEIIVLKILPKEYTLSFREAFAMVREVIPDFSKEEFIELQDAGKIDWMYVNGEVHYFRRFLSTLLKVNKDLDERTKTSRLQQRLVEKKESTIEQMETDALSKVITDMISERSVTYHFRIRNTVRIKEEVFQPGKVRVHLAIPASCEQVNWIKVIKTLPVAKLIAAPEVLQRTAYIEENLNENQDFVVEYEYENKVTYIEPIIEIVQATKQPGVHNLGSDFIDEVAIEDFIEQAPHIMFTPTLTSLAREIIGEEVNNYKRARRIYDFVTTKITYSFMREYFTIENITEYAALGGKGDCGVQALLFITLCRISGIPARWQSGLYSTPYTATSHDWAQFYIAPYGWLFADCSFGGSAYRIGDFMKWNFYFGNLDPFRMPANSAFQKEFDPPKKYLRADPYDNQRGEIEYEDRGLAYNEFTSMNEVVECYKL